MADCLMFIKIGRNFRVNLLFEKQLRALRQLPFQHRIVQVDATGGLVRKIQGYSQILNYVMLLKNITELSEPGICIGEMATSSHDIYSIEKLFDLLRFKYDKLYPKERLFPIMICDFSWATMVINSLIDVNKLYSYNSTNLSTPLYIVSIVKQC